MLKQSVGPRLTTESGDNSSLGSDLYHIAHRCLIHCQYTLLISEALSDIKSLAYVQTRYRPTILNDTYSIFVLFACLVSRQYSCGLPWSSPLVSHPQLSTVQLRGCAFWDLEFAQDGEKKRSQFNRLDRNMWLVKNTMTVVSWWSWLLASHFISLRGLFTRISCLAKQGFS